MRVVLRSSATLFLKLAFLRRNDDDHKVRYALMEDLLDATVREKAAFDKFNAALNRLPTGLPHPGGSQRIRNASHELDAKRAKEGPLAPQ